MKVRVNSITIKSFRGVSVTRTIDLTKNGKETCTLVVGDNGSGKSSIVDAIEFVTQAKVHNTSSLTTSRKVEAFNQFTDLSPSVQVSLNDGSTFDRTVTIAADGKRLFEHKAMMQFKTGPFILRRSNILQFWNTPQIQRQVLFLNYNLANDKTQYLGESFLDRVKELEEEKTDRKKRKREALQAISGIKKIKVEEIPNSKLNFAEWAQRNIFLHLSLEKFEAARRQGRKIGVDPNLEVAAKSVFYCNTDIERIDAELKRYKPSGSTTSKDITNRMFAEISESITTTFRKLSTVSEDLDNIIIHIAEESEVSLGFEAVMKNGRSVVPEQFLSEANLDLLALVVFIEITKKSVELGQAPVLVLDDVFQSVDAGVRLRILQHILEDLAGWQLIVTVHDRLWKEQLVELFRANNVELQIIEILGWSSSEGIRFQAESHSLEDSLARNIESGSINEVFSNASILLEKVCTNLSYRLPISIARRRGDKYTLGDLWPGIYKELKKTNISSIVSTVNDIIYLRNLIGGHYNEWALSLTRKDATDFATSILLLTQAVQCSACGNWIEEIKLGSRTIGHSCRCQRITIVPKKAD